MNPIQMMRIKGMWDRFRERHPKLPLFINAVGSNCIVEGSIFEIDVTTPEGGHYTTNLKLTAEDIETIQQLKDLSAKQKK